MSTAIDALPVIIPFFGVTVCTGLVAICCLWRAVNSRFISLEHRMEQLTILPVNPPTTVTTVTPPPPPQNYPAYPVYPGQAVPYPLYPNLTYNI
jgi:hypothetical protein